ncbi:hypothetical protein Taro_032094 [Colocasia esculenta]|uniref:Uncharacterized protein n=1 Tax=Colocasia esculenta TaxID=4460 RepID=A0A843W2W5_COLES|nr:hypothetical protein [Colocasia esculenta]
MNRSFYGGHEPRQLFACETWSLGGGLPVRLEVEVLIMNMFERDGYVRVRLGGQWTEGAGAVGLVTGGPPCTQMDPSPPLTYNASGAYVMTPSIPI